MGDNGGVSDPKMMTVDGIPVRCAEGKYDVSYLLWGVAPAPDPARVEKMRRAIMAEAKHVAGALGLPAEPHGCSYRGEHVPTIGGLLSRMAEGIVTEFDRFSVEDALPKIGAPRGGIRYLDPSVDAAMRARKPSRLERVRRSRRQFVAWRKRVADTRAVYRGEKDAYTAAEIDDLVDR